MTNAVPLNWATRSVRQMCGKASHTLIYFVLPAFSTLYKADGQIAFCAYYIHNACSHHSADHFPPAPFLSWNHNRATDIANFMRFIRNQQMSDSLWPALVLLAISVCIHTLLMMPVWKEPNSTQLYLPWTWHNFYLEWWESPHFVFV